MHPRIDSGPRGRQTSDRATVGNYRVKALLGEGGMGTVYLVEHSLLGWQAAIKVLRPSLADDKVLVTRFINEARAVKAVRHDNIIDIIDVGSLGDGLPYLLMELLEGDSLGARLHSRGRLSVEQAVDITRQTAGALGAVHDQGIVHRDLKPDNLFLVPDPQDPAREKVKVLDFGIAKLRENGATGSNPRTRSGVLLGTPAYMSPEQCRGIAGAVDHRTDIYALAVILYEMLAGRAPFVSPGAGDVLIMHVSQETPAGASRKSGGAGLRRGRHLARAGQGPRASFSIDGRVRRGAERAPAANPVATRGWRGHAVGRHRTGCAGDRARFAVTHDVAFAPLEQALAIGRTRDPRRRAARRPDRVQRETTPAVGGRALCRSCRGGSRGFRDGENPARVRQCHAPDQHEHRSRRAQPDPQRSLAARDRTNAGASHVTASVPAGDFLDGPPDPRWPQADFPRSNRR